MLYRVFLLKIYLKHFSEAAKDLNMQLGQPANLEANKLKQLTSPLSKLARGMQNIGLNLDPRKIATKVNTLHIYTVNDNN